MSPSPTLKLYVFEPNVENLNPARGLTFDFGKNFPFTSAPNPIPAEEYARS